MVTKYIDTRDPKTGLTPDQLMSKRRPMSQIHPYGRNPRTHPKEQIELLAQHMKQYGIDQPIVVDEAGVILKGHGRRLAAIAAGFKSFPVIVRSGLSEEEKKMMRIADNKIQLLGGWDDVLLGGEFGTLSLEGFDTPLLPMTGFTMEEIKAFASVTLQPYEDSPPLDRDADAVPELPSKPVSKPGDVWLLGGHRLLCGDATSKANVVKLLGKDRPNLMVTDPPYGIAYNANWRNEAERTTKRRGKIGASAIGKVANDDRADWREAWKLFPGNIAYCWHADRYATDVDLSFRAAGFEVRSQIIWAKSRMIISRGDYHWQHEPCWYLVRKGAKGHWTGDRSQTTLWTIPHPASESGHSAQKPAEAMRRPIANNSQAGDAVYDPFVGSGTTIIACEMMARVCLAIEISPAYCDVAIQRWQKFTGKRATLDGKSFEEVARSRRRR